MFIESAKINFPKLKSLGSVEVKHKEKPFKSNLFYIDWKGLDNFKYQKTYEWVKQQWSNSSKDLSSKMDSYVGVIDNRLKKLSDNFVFAISNEYLNIIKYHIESAKKDMKFSVKSDTMIREYCYKPADSHIHVAFFLIADSLFDKDEQYFDRNYSLHGVHSILLWRLFSRQVGYGTLGKKCKIDELRERLVHSSHSSYRYNFNKFVVDSFDEWLRMIEKERDIIMGPQHNVDNPVGPSLEE